MALWGPAVGAVACAGGGSSGAEVAEVRGVEEVGGFGGAELVERRGAEHGSCFVAASRQVVEGGNGSGEPLGRGGEPDSTAVSAASSDASVSPASPATLTARLLGEVGLLYTQCCQP